MTMTTRSLLVRHCPLIIILMVVMLLLDMPIAQALLTSPNSKPPEAATSNDNTSSSEPKRQQQQRRHEKACQDLGLDHDRLLSTLYSGRVYQQEDFLSEKEVQVLLDNVSHLQEQGACHRSGLSNTNKGSNMQKQDFGSQDRFVCNIPWWLDALEERDIDSTSSDPEGKKNGDLRDVVNKLMSLRRFLAHVLDRPSMLDPHLSHEAYFSVSNRGSFLPRHMDERHEELKGRNGWLRSSRRSISWLLYLSDDGWTLEQNGGALRTFPQSATMATREGGDCSSYSSSSHDGNLQVGWLRRQLPTPSSPKQSQPVYLDSWIPVMTDHGKEAHCVLYTVNEVSGGGDRQALTRPWLSTQAMESMETSSLGDFVQSWAARDAATSKTTTPISSPQLFLDAQEAADFVLLEDRPAWDRGEDPEGAVVVDVAPLRGSLVVFDSLLLPHQVESVRDGTRIALAGWFHEATQPFPEEFVG